MSQEEILLGQILAALNEVANTQDDILALGESAVGFMLGGFAALVVINAIQRLFQV